MWCSSNHCFTNCFNSNPAWSEANPRFISPCYLSTLFSKLVGTSLLAYINDYRMHQAVSLLTQTDTTVTDICYLVGYRNLPYFCTCFKTKYHMTPAQYRRSSVELAEVS